MMEKFSFKKYNGILYVISVLLLLFITYKISIFLLPFLFSLIIIWIVKPIVNFVNNKLHLDSKFIRSLILILFYITVGGLVIFAIFRIIIEGYKFSTYIFNIQNSIIDSIDTFLHKISTFNKYLPKELGDYIVSLFENMTSFIEKIFSYVTRYLVNIFSAGLSFIKKLPNILIFFFIMVLSSFTILNDEKHLIESLKKQFPKSWVEKSKEIKEGVLEMLVVYIKAQLILILLCFFELFIGLSLINLFIYELDYVLLFAFIICFMEALPLIGAGIIIFPWILICLINQNYPLALALLVLELVVVVVRQLLEPRLISKASETNPLLTLIAIYSGFQFFGILGFLIGPILLSVLNIVFHDEIEYGFFKFLISESNDSGDNNEEEEKNENEENI